MLFQRFTALTILGAMLASSAPISSAAKSVDGAQYAGLRWRFVGPLRGGRTKSVAGVANMPNRFYTGAVDGGVWQTDDAGRTWRPIFDAESSGSIGSIAVAPSDSNVIYVGSGEGMQRPDLSVGNGIYKSIDAGATWTHLGLRDGKQIPNIAVDPKNPERLLVAVLGHPYGPNAERGIFLSTDGGATFKPVLQKGENVGGNDVKIDPNDSNVAYATMWAARTAPWEMGPFEIAGSGVYKTSDGGATWTQLTNGLPPRIGRSEIAVAPSQSNVVYASVDAPSGCAIYRSDDAGAHFTMTSSDERVCARSGDLLMVAVDPKDANTVYATSTSTYRSTDGGKTFVPIKGAPGGDDYGYLWINPSDPNIIAIASDQGTTISVNHGASWSSWYNQPTGQMYHVNADDRFPYWVCGGQQDSGSACVSSRGPWGQTNERDWHPAGAEEYGYAVPDPLHPGVVFGGKVERFDERTGQSQEVSPNPLRSKPYRVVRTEPIAFDNFDKRTMYFGANQVYKTRDGGQHWAIVSPDLTRAHWAMPSVIAAFEGGDPQHGTHRGVVYALSPSHTHAGTIWAGTDDGLVWITRNGGHSWSKIGPPLTAWSKISQIDAGHHDDNTAYVAVNRIRLDDYRPWIYRTHDGGAHWSAISNGIASDEIVNAVREDPYVPGLLYAAGESNVYVSFDDGDHWQSRQLNLPHSSNRDIIVHGNDLVVATHGRGFWILDNVEPLRELAKAGTIGSNHLFTPSVAYRLRRNVNSDTPLPPDEPHGTNPPDGAMFDYLLASPAANVALTIRNASGNVVRRFTNRDAVPASLTLDKPEYWERPFVKLSNGTGTLHRFVWDLHEASPQSVATDLPISANEHDTPRTPQGALVAPGRYTVELSVDGRTQTRPLEIRMDPNSVMSSAALATQYAMAHETARLLDATFAAMNDAKSKKQAKAADTFGGLNGRLSFLIDLIDGADAPVPQGTTQAFCALRAEAHSAGISTPRTSLCP